MSKKIASRKLQLNKETLRSLNRDELDVVGGASAGDAKLCYSSACTGGSIYAGGGGNSLILMLGCGGGVFNSLGCADGGPG